MFCTPLQALAVMRGLPVLSRCGLPRASDAMTAAGRNWSRYSRPGTASLAVMTVSRTPVAT